MATTEVETIETVRGHLIAALAFLKELQRGASATKKKAVIVEISRAMAKADQLCCD